MTRGTLLVLSGPSGVGKSTAVAALQKLRPQLRFSISATTRPPRPSERDGVNYYFVDRPAFETMIEALKAHSESYPFPHRSTRSVDFVHSQPVFRPTHRHTCNPP